MRHLPQRVVTRFLGVERSPKAEVTHDVKHKMVYSLTKVYRSRPLGRAIMLIQQNLVPTVDMLTDKGRDGSHRLISKACVEHLASLGVFRGVYGVQSRFFANVLGQSNIECAPANIGLHTIDCRMSLWVTEQNQIRRDADPLSIDLE